MAGRRKVLSAAFANLMQSVSQFEKPYGHVEVLRHLLLRARPVQTDFIVESVLPMLENAPASTKQFFQGALGFIRRYLSKKLANFKVPAEILLEGLGEEWRFRIPDVEQEVGALNDIRKSGMTGCSSFRALYYIFINEISCRPSPSTLEEVHRSAFSVGSVPIFSSAVLEGFARQSKLDVYRPGQNRESRIAGQHL